MFAEVAVDAAVVRRTFSYSVPKGLEIVPGQLVWVPFGSRVLQGIVFQLTESPSFEPTRDIAGTISSTSLLSPIHLGLALWISQYYLCPLFAAASPMLPPGFTQRILSSFSVASGFGSPSRRLTELQERLVRHIRQRGVVKLAQLEKSFGKAKVGTAVGQLVKRGVLLKTDELERPTVGPKTVRYALLSVPSADWEAFLEGVRRRGRPNRQAELLEYMASNEGKTVSELKGILHFSRSAIQRLIEKGLVQLSDEGKVILTISSSDALELAARARVTKKSERLGQILEALSNAGARLAVPELSKLTGATGADLEILTDAGLVAIEEQEVFRDPLANRVFPQIAVPELTTAQERIWREIEATVIASKARAGKGEPSSVFLLHGVTGSGKTEIYLRALSLAVKMGQQAIVMVPEIALTPQTVGRFLSRFPGRVAVLHSRLSIGEQFDEWRRIQAGEFDVVIGSRGAIFSPVPRLGLIVLDEEHEWTYKQIDPEPRYHARDVAIKLAELTGASVILGSATPDVTSYHRARSGEFKLVELRERVTSSGWASKPGSSVPGRMATVEIVDLRQELRAGNRSIFSRSLVNAATVALAAQEQIILFLNRRGTSTFVICRDCGFVLKCKRCDIPLTYHSDEDDMICHLCNYRTIAPDICPNCWSRHIRYLGVGTQKVEDEARKAFPEARVLRWDRDSARRKGAHEDILDRFTSHEADILIGTQMIAKGLDLPKVTLVGVVCADIDLHLPDYVSSEHTFQILTQVAGRAGRGVLMGKTIIQTYSPEHYAVAAAAQQDYSAFYRREIAFRDEHANPPFGQLAKLVHVGTNNEKCQREAQRVCSLLKSTMTIEGLMGLSLIGPAPAYISRLRGRYRWQVVVRGHNLQKLLAGIQLPSGWTIDIDPVSLL